MEDVSLPTLPIKARAVDLKIVEQLSVNITRDTTDFNLPKNLNIIIPILKNYFSYLYISKKSIIFKN